MVLRGMVEALGVGGRVAVYSCDWWCQLHGVIGGVIGGGIPDVDMLFHPRRNYSHYVCPSWDLKRKNTRHEISLKTLVMLCCT